MLIPEVLLAILQYALPDECTRTFDYRPVHWSLTTRRTRNPLFDAGMADLSTLLAACLVCKEWYAAGVTILYARPVIATARHWQRDRFCHTLQDNLFLSGLVHHPCLFYTEPGSERHIREYLYSQIELEAARARCVNELAASLLHCVNLISLNTLSYHAMRITTPLEKIFPALRIRNILRQLVITGDGLSGAFGLPSWNGSLPSLEVLRLHRVYLPIGHTFPELPALTTLQFAKCRLDPGFREENLFLVPDDLPGPQARI